MLNARSICPYPNALPESAMNLCARALLVYFNEKSLYEIIRVKFLMFTLFGIVYKIHTCTFVVHEDLCIQLLSRSSKGSAFSSMILESSNHGRDSNIHSQSDPPSTLFFIPPSHTQQHLLESLGHGIENLPSFLYMMDSISKRLGYILFRHATSPGVLTKRVQEAGGGKEKRVRKIGSQNGFDEQKMTEASVTILSPVANHKVVKCSPTDTHAWSPQQFVTSLFKKAPPPCSQWTPGLLVCLQDNSILSSPSSIHSSPNPGSFSPSSLASLHHHPICISSATRLIPNSHRLLLPHSHFRSLSHRAPSFRSAWNESGRASPLLCPLFSPLTLSSFNLSCLFFLLICSIYVAAASERCINVHFTKERQNGWHRCSVCLVTVFVFNPWSRFSF